MKKEQQVDQKRNDQNNKQQLDTKNTSSNQQKNQTQQGSNQSPGNQQVHGNERSNIHVGNDGKIGKAHDQWPKDNNADELQKNREVRNDKTNTGPEVDAPIYDPEKTEKKIPQMNNKK